MSISIGPINPVTFIRPAPVALPVSIPVSHHLPGDSVSVQDTALKPQTSTAQSFAVSDRTFSLYKDASGQMITRYVSLLDGSITYLPQPVYTKPLAPQLAISV